ncbi:ligand-binding sensor domain-containing protein [Larkinella sp. GY13]|uniref:ligand-binding sensor domain-containing protein n=1 Tax=Larkinella sp. GY13 TaxID=3453720 RepID=UPI003EEDD9B5
MTKLLHVCALMMFVFCNSCKGKDKTDLSKDTIKSETKDTVTSRVPTSMVRNIKQARNGDILIASWKGVFRYNGKSFTNITSNIPSPSFWDVLEDRKGNLWFATRDSGVYYYDGKSFQHFTTKDGLASNQALHIYEDKTGNIWFGASRYDGKSFRNFTTKDGFPSNSIRLLLEDKTGKLWFGAQGENMFVYDGKTFTVLKNKDGKAFNNVWSIIEDKKGSIWFGDVDGLWRYDGRTFTKVSQRGAYAIIEDKKGNIWTTGEVNPQVWALSRYDAKSLYDKMPTVTEIVSGGPALLGILEANDGSIWFGGLGSMSGVYRYDGKTITDFKSKEVKK